ncbi:hypothetical protein ACG3RN_25555, partial [Pseudomonas aeruginosa]
PLSLSLSPRAPCAPLPRPCLSLSLSIVWWDNQAVLHARNAFPASERRRLKRISLAGSRPF